MTSTTELMSTAEALHRQWLEPTGRHMLDSGGAYGRNWERNQGKPLEAWTEAPPVSVTEWGVSINTLRYLSEHLNYSKRSEELTKQFRAYVERMPEGDAYYNSTWSLQEWLELLADRGSLVENVEGFNTYNWENMLDSTLQGVEFDLDGVAYVALSYHGGCDVRGGYTDLVLYERCDCWLHGTDSAYVWCSNSECEVRFDMRGGYIEWTEGTDKEIDPDMANPCPECGTPFTQGSYQGCGW